MLLYSLRRPLISSSILHLVSSKSCSFSWTVLSREWIRSAAPSACFESFCSSSAILALEFWRASSNSRPVRSSVSSSSWTCSCRPLIAWSFSAVRSSSSCRRAATAESPSFSCKASLAFKSSACCLDASFSISSSLTSSDSFSCAACFASSRELWRAVISSSFEDSNSCNCFWSASCAFLLLIAVSCKACWSSASRSPETATWALYLSCKSSS
mmetsp:Transcript_1957/g.12336  ORF Transcript_1957/g.12336 Transcript_1957/m.12336 type:complete len:213 (-) Transcript_1957:1494-2132(-)